MYALIMLQFYILISYNYVNEIVKNKFDCLDYQQLIRKGPYNHQFTVQHFHGTNPVVYSVTGWLRYSREHATARQISNLLQESQK